MMLTPKEVRMAQLTVHRFREGYDTDEVDEFMDTAADTISRLASHAQALQADIQRYKAIINKLKEKD